MIEKKDTPVGFKLSETDKKRAEKISAIFGHKPGAMAGILIREFMKAYDTHGSNLKFPPEFIHFTNLETNQLEEDKRDAFEKAG